MLNSREESAVVPAQTPARAKRYVYPGQLFAAAEPHEISTILGSCVAVCLFDPVRRIGGLNHFLLPFRPEQLPRSPRYGDEAVRMLVERLVAVGARSRNLEAKVFGGGKVIEAFRGNEGHLGARNVESALAELDAIGIGVVAKDVGGPHGRKLVFQTDDGVVLLRKL